MTFNDCQEAFESGERCPGVYTLRDPDTSMEFDVYCEFDNEHGWTVIQRRLDGSVDFYRGWDDYVAGFGNLSQEYWLDVSSLVVCSLSCLEDKKCVSTLYVASIQECQLFSSCLPDVTSTDGNTDLVYIRKYGVANKYRDCQEAFECGVQVSGVYTLRDPDTSMEFDVYCEFDSEHGWTVIQRRLDGSVDFYRGWDDYVAGFGSLLGEYWLGLEHIYYLTMTNQQLSIYLESHEGEVAHANYSTFYIDGSSNNYSLTLQRMMRLSLTVPAI
ncbi:hypothetical protein EB796_008373 [Bugula neritina]|uniref:Fibrinogen C-terminal domain-containing protein n=1 Tax=Bugula neritina TaxID=10212 RepID=A0A7J7K3W3_BUGNE|nr:hypothetical protein EB796_008373 [Bugula neritina]